MSWVEQRLPGVNDVRGVAEDVFARQTRLRRFLLLSDFVGFILVELDRVYDVQTDRATVMDAVLGAVIGAGGFAHNYVVVKLTPQLITALHRAVLLPCCRKLFS